MEINSSSSNRGGGMMAMINDQSNDHHHHHQQQQIELPPGFRFHPTDEELITHYLSPKIIDAQFNPVAIGEVDLNKVEPWDLPRKAKMGEKEWYFFCVKDRKYPTGLRTNRATEAGYWKATGKDKEIFRGKALVGMKKTLVFYTGRAPKGNKTNWVMHEYRLEGGRSASSSNYNTTLLKSSKDDWVICRVFNKGSNLKKVPGPGSVLAGRMMMIDTDTDTDSQYDGGGGGGGSDLHDEHHHPYLPPLMDSSPVSGPFNQNASSSGSVRQYYTPPQHVTCFSTTAAAREEVGNDMNLLKSLPKQSDGFQFNNVANRDYYNTATTAAAAAAVSCSSSSMLPDSTSSFGMNQGAGQLSGQDPVYFQDQSSVLRMLLDGNNYGSDYYGFGAAVGCAGGANHTTAAMSGGEGTYADMSSGGNNAVPCSEMVRRNQSSYQPLLQQGNNQMNPNRLDSSSSVDLDCLLNF